MTSEQKAAYIYAKTVSMYAEIQGMVAENQQRIHRNESIAYDLDAFMLLRDKYGLDENSLVVYCFRED